MSELLEMCPSKHLDLPMIVLNGCTKPGRSYKLKMEEEEKRTQGGKGERN